MAKLVSGEAPLRCACLRSRSPSQQCDASLLSNRVGSTAHGSARTPLRCAFSHPASSLRLPVSLPPMNAPAGPSLIATARYSASSHGHGGLLRVLLHGLVNLRLGWPGTRCTRNRISTRRSSSCFAPYRRLHGNHSQHFFCGTPFSLPSLTPPSLCAFRSSSCT